MVKWFSPPDEFSASPLLSLLPEGQSLRKLQALDLSFFARYQNVVAIKSAADFESGSEDGRRVVAEEQMLKHVLDWLGENRQSEE